MSNESSIPFELLHSINQRKLLMRISILTLTFILAFSSLSSGQIQKGTWTLDGDLFSSYPGYAAYFIHTYDFRLQSEASYFITKNFNLGAKIGANCYDFLVLSAFPVPDTISRLDLTTTLSLRYYINPKQKVKVYGQIDPGLGFGFSRLNRKAAIVDPETGDELPKEKFRRDEFHLRPNIEMGFNYFISPNIALETALNYRLFYHEKERDFINGEFIDDHLTFYPRDLWTFDIGMRFFFNVENEKEISYLPKDYLKKGNLTFGINLGYSAYIAPNYYSSVPYHSSPHVSYFLFDRLAIGTTLNFVMERNTIALGLTPSIEYYQPISPKFQIVPSLEAYFGTDTHLLSLNDYYGDFGSIFNLGVKANYFITENVSIWGGPFFNRIKMYWEDLEYHINLKGGFRYYMVSKKNR